MNNSNTNNNQTISFKVVEGEFVASTTLDFAGVKPLNSDNELELLKSPEETEEHGVSFFIVYGTEFVAEQLTPDFYDTSRQCLSHTAGFSFWCIKTIASLCRFKRLALYTMLE
jgi:hypothetical protein